MTDYEIYFHLNSAVVALEILIPELVEDNELKGIMVAKNIINAVKENYAKSW